MGIFSRFFTQQPPILNAVFQPNSLIQYHAGYPLKPALLLQVRQGQNVLLFGDKVTDNLLASGEYPLSQHTCNVPQLNIIFFNSNQRVKRRWQSLYQPSDRELEHSPAGEYSLSIENAGLFSTILKENAVNTALNDEFIDQWIAFIIDQAFIKESVSADDIENKADVLQSFLFEVLQWQLKNYGLNLHKLKLFSRPQPAPAPSEQVAESEPLPVHDDEKLFYRVKGGEQVGPYSSAEIQQFIDKNDLTRRELLWKKGMTAWKAAESFGIFIWD